MTEHRLDRAIDHVAKRLTQVDDDTQFASRIIAALPDRRTWFGWLTHASAPRLALLAIVAGTFAVWSMRHTTEVTPAPQPLATVANVNWPQLVASAVAVRRENAGDSDTGNVSLLPCAWRLSAATSDCARVM